MPLSHLVRRTQVGFCGNIPHTKIYQNCNWASSALSYDAPNAKAHQVVGKSRTDRFNLNQSGDPARLSQSSSVGLAALPQPGKMRNYVLERDQSVPATCKQIPTSIFPGLKSGFQTREPYPKTQSEVDSSMPSDFSSWQLPVMFSFPFFKDFYMKLG